MKMSQSNIRDLMPVPSEIVFSVKTWEGEYFSRDIPGGVETTPLEGAIYTIHGDGNGQQQVVGWGRNTDYPSFSPDGQWIYFQSRLSGQSQVYRCRPDGSDITNLTADNRLGEEWQEAFGYALAQDGRTIVYIRHDGHSGRIVLAHADGSAPCFVAPHLGYMYMASLSAQGDRLVCTNADASYRLKLLTFPDCEYTDLTPDHPGSIVPRFTPDGQTIVFMRTDGDIYSVRSDGSELRRLTRGNAYNELKLSAADQHGSSDGPDISPNGEQVAYIAVRDGVANVWTMALDGSRQEQITFRKSSCGRVRWSPDGKRLAFISFVGRFPQLFVVNVESGALRQLTQVEGAVYFLNWNPNPLIGSEGL
jgi:TolB protein